MSFVKSSPPKATATTRSLARQIASQLTIASAVSIHGTSFTVSSASPSRPSKAPIRCDTALTSPAVRTLPTDTA
jgi:hypothetical protein